MIRIYYSDQFLRAARRLENKLQDKLTELIVLLKENPFHSKLHSKKLSGEIAGIYSFRITRDWRVLFKFLSPLEIQLIDVGRRKEIYR